MNIRPGTASLSRSGDGIMKNENVATRGMEIEIPRWSQSGMSSG